MARISSYGLDGKPELGDKVVGTDTGAEANLRTKNYSLQEIVDLFNKGNSLAVADQSIFLFQDNLQDGRDAGTISFASGGGIGTNFSVVTSILLSKTASGGKVVTNFLQLFNGKDIILAEVGNINNFGQYRVSNITEYIPDTNFYEVTLFNIASNGVFSADAHYIFGEFSSPGSLSTPWDIVADGINYPDGNVGVGTVTPSEKLEVSGGIIGDTLFVRNTGGYNAELLSNNLTTNRTFNFPDVGGTLALTTDITASPWDTVTGGINYANGNVGIGTTTPSAKLDVNGDALINGLTVGQGAGTSAFGNTVFGKTALDSITTGLRNVAIGSEALLDNTVGNYNIALGYRSLENNSANNNVAIGVEALQRVETAGNNTAVGRYTLGLTSGAGNTAIGYAAGYLRVGGTNGGSINSVFIGSLTTSNGINPENEIVIGTGAVSAGSNTVVLGNDDIVSTRLKGDVIVANGNVGIGTTSPVEKLEVLGYIKSSVGFKANTYTSLLESSNDTVISNSAYYNMLFKTNNAERMRITNAGNVGIGTTSPSARLEVQQSADNQGLKILGFDNESNSNLHFYVDNFGNDRITSSEFLNITSGGSSSYTAAGYLRLRGVGATSQVELDGSTIKFTVTSSEKMRLTSTGLGIGTTSPNESLHIEASDPRIKIVDADGTNWESEVFTQGGALKLQARNGTNFGNISFQGDNGTAQSEYARFNSVGNFGIGTTSPGEKLDVNGNIKLRGTNNLTIGSTSTGGNFSLSSGIRGFNFANNNGDLVRIDSSGKVGIGTTTPTEKLEVAGRISISNTGKSVFLGNKAGENDDFSDNGNTAIGEQSLRANILGIENVAIGYSALLISTANRNTAVGVETLRRNSTGQNNTALGYRAMYYNQTGNSNVALGFSALWRLTSGIRNVVIGDQSGIVTSTGNLTVANDSIFIGAGAKALGDNQTNQVVIGKSAQGLGSNTVVLGNSSVVTTQLQGNVGIGTTSPGQKLEVSGNVKLDGDNRNIYFGGNNTFIGERSNSTELELRGGGNSTAQTVYIDNTGQIGVGTSNPGQKLEVNGQVLSDGYRLAAMQTAPATRNSTGTLGEIVIDGNHIYVCYATDSWSRVALDTSW